MRISFNLPSYADFAFRRNSSFSLTSRQAKIIGLCALAFTCLAACYLVKRYFNAKVIQGTSSLDQLKSFFTPINPTLDKGLGQPQEGLNMEGKCKNITCEFYDKLVIIPKGLGSFDITRECCKSQCPSCQSKIDYDDIHAIILSSCQFEIDGQNVKNQRVQGVFKVLPKQDLRLVIEDWYFIELKVKK